MVFAAGVLVFRYCVLHLNIFPRQRIERWISSPAAA
jgi:hypothetical protein